MRLHCVWNRVSGGPGCLYPQHVLKGVCGRICWRLSCLRSLDSKYKAVTFYPNFFLSSAKTKVIPETYWYYGPSGTNRPLARRLQLNFILLDMFIYCKRLDVNTTLYYSRSLLICGSAIQICKVEIHTD